MAKRTGFSCGMNSLRGCIVFEDQRIYGQEFSALVIFYDKIAISRTHDTTITQFSKLVSFYCLRGKYHRRYRKGTYLSTWKTTCVLVSPLETFSLPVPVPMLAR